MNHTLMLMGRLMMAAIFVVAGYGKLLHHEATITYMADAGMPFPSVVYYGALLMELGVGLGLAAGLFTRAAALALAVFCVVTALIFHSNFGDPNMRIQFLKNGIMAGALLFPAALGGGAFSLDAMLGRGDSQHGVPRSGSGMTAVLMLLGRILAGGLFAYDGFGKLTHAETTLGLLTHASLPMPTLAYGVSILVELGAGLALIFGLFTRLSGLVLVLWCLVTAALFHIDFTVPGQQINFLKNITMAGGLLYVVVFGAGLYSIDAAIARRRSRGPAVT